MRNITIHRSLWKPILWMGCERAPFMIIMISSALLVVEGGFIVKIVGVVYFVIMTGLLAYLNNKDPFFFKVLFRYLSYQDFYPSTAMWPGKKSFARNLDD